MSAARNSFARALTGAASAASRPTTSTWTGGSIAIADHLLLRGGGGGGGEKRGLLATATSFAAGGGVGARARGFHGDLSGGAAGAAGPRLAAAAAAVEVPLGGGRMQGSTTSTTMRGIEGLGVGGGTGMIGGVNPRRRGGQGGRGWSAGAGQTRLASGGRGWFGFGGSKAGKGDEGGTGGGTGGAEFDAAGASSKAAAAAAAASNGDGGASTMDAAVHGGGGVVAGTASAAVLAEAFNPALMAADPFVIGEVLNIAGESWATTAGLMYVIEYFHLAHDMDWWAAIVATTRRGLYKPNTVAPSIARNRLVSTLEAYEVTKAKPAFNVCFHKMKTFSKVCSFTFDLYRSTRRHHACGVHPADHHAAAQRGEAAPGEARDRSAEPAGGGGPERSGEAGGAPDENLGRVGTFHHVTRILQSKHQLMTAGMVHVTNMTPGSDNPRRAYGKKHQLMTASIWSM
jgi:hypothetical protein